MVDLLRNWNNKSHVLAAVKKDGTKLEYASEELKNDHEVVLAAIKAYGVALKYASDRLKCDREFILKVVKQNGYALQYTSEELQNDVNVVLAAVKQAGQSLEHASEVLKDNRDIVLAAIDKDYRGLQYASEKLKSDNGFVLEAIKQKSKALMFASEAAKGNCNIVLAAVTQSGMTLQYASEELRCDRDVVLAAVKHRGMALQYASDELKGNGNIVLAAVTQYGFALQYASEGLKGDPDIVLVALEKYGEVIEYASSELLADKQFISKAEQKNPDVVHWYSNRPQDRSPRHAQIEACASPKNLRWLNKQSCTRKVVFQIMLLFYLHVALITCFLQASTETNPSPGWSIAILPISGAFLCLEYVQYKGYKADKKSSDYYLDVWNWIELATIGLTISSAVVLLVENSMSSGARNLLTTTGFFLCTFFLSFLRKTFLAFAIFVDGVVHIIAVLIPFIVVSFLILGTFAFGYSMQNNESLEGSLLTMYTKFTGQDDIFDDLEDLIDEAHRSTLDAAESNETWEISLDIIFGTLIIIVLLNVVIAVVSDAWSDVANKSKEVYKNYQNNRSRLILDIIVGSGYSDRRFHSNVLGLQNFLDKDWNTKNLKDYLEHWNYPRRDADYLEHWNYPRRDAIEKPHNLCQFGAMISMLTCLTLCGFVSFGSTWPMFVREFLFTYTETETNAIEKLTEKVEEQALENKTQSERIETLLQLMEQQFQRMEQRTIQSISNEQRNIGAAPIISSNQSETDSDHSIPLFF